MSKLRAYCEAWAILAPVVIAPAMMIWGVTSDVIFLVIGLTGLATQLLAFYIAHIKSKTR